MMPFIGRAMILVVPILDDLIYELFDMHIIEPLIVYSEETKVRPVLNKPHMKFKEHDAVHIIDSIKQFPGKQRLGFLSPQAKV